MIEFRNVSKTYADSVVKAVDNISFRVRDGEIFGFLGPNGAGKTTCIKMIVGILEQDEGEILLSGINVREEPLETKKRFSYVPDNPDLYNNLTGSEYLAFMGDIYEVSQEDRRKIIPELAKRWGIEENLSQKIGSYSHGMKQKLALIGALLHDPDVFILDEPMVGLDPRSSFELKEIMRERCDRGKTVFFSTHVMEVAEKICDRIGIISKGKLIALGTMEELRAMADEEASLEQLFLELTDDEE